MSFTPYVQQRYYDVSKIVLWADNPAEEGKRARLSLSFRDGNPRLIVYTGALGKDGIINFPLDIPHMAAVMAQFKELAEGEPDNQIKVESLTPVYDNNRPTNEKRVVSTLLMGKSKEGIMYMCLVAEGKPKIVFPIKSSPYHTWRTSNNESVSEAVVSKHMAIGIANSILAAVSSVMMAYTHEEYASGTRKSTSTAQSDTGGNRSSNNRASKQPDFVDLDDVL